MPIFMIIALDIIITMRFSINCLTVICSTTVIYAILREATSETYGPRVYFTSYKFPIYNSSLLFILQSLFSNLYNQKYQKYLSYYLYQISLLQVVVKGWTTPLSCWLQGSWLFVQVLGDLRVVSYWIDTLNLKNWGKYLRYFAASPFPLQGKTNAWSRGSKKDFWRRRRGDLCSSQGIPSTHHKLFSLALHYLPFASRFPLPHFTFAFSHCPLVCLSLPFYRHGRTKRG